jgi:hypothetical protein
MRKLFFALILVLVVFPILSNAQDKDEHITIYSDDFAGNKLELGPGKYDYMYLVRAGNMVVRSLKVPQGMKVILYERDNFEGKSLTITDNIRQSQLEAKGFGSVTMNVSLVVEKIPAGQMPAPGTFITIYGDDLSGTSKDLVAGRYDFSDLGDVGNDNLSSIKVPNGMKVTLYEHGGFKGRSISFTSDARSAMLKSKKFNDLTSSILVEESIVDPKPAEKEKPVVAPVVKTTTSTPVVDPVIGEPTEPIIYQGDFSGPSKSLSPGRYGKDKLGIANNELSSIKVPKGFRVTLYDGDAFEGKSLVLTADAPASFFVDSDFNNLTSSVWVEALPMVTVYEGDYGGVSARLLPGRYKGHDFVIGNDQLSSVRVPRGLSVTLFEDENFGGRSISLTQDSGMDVLTANSFNNETSSLAIEETTITPPVVTGPVVTVYSDKFSGSSQTFTPGRYALNNIMVGDDQISSATVPSGLRLILFEDDEFKGYSLTAEGNIDLAVSKVFDNRASSLIVEDATVPKVVPTQPQAPAPDPVQETQNVTTESTPSCEMSTAQFENAYRSIESKHFMEEMMTAARLTTKDRCLSVPQIRSIAKLFMSDDQSLEFVKYAYDLSMEKSEYYLLEDVFKFMSTREAFNKFLQGK